MKKLRLKVVLPYLDKLILKSNEMSSTVVHRTSLFHRKENYCAWGHFNHTVNDHIAIIIFITLDS